MNTLVRLPPAALDALFDALFASDEAPTVAADYSEYEQPLSYFAIPTDIRAALPRPPSDPFYQLGIWYPSMRGRILEERITLDPRFCQGHTFRYRLSG